MEYGESLPPAALAARPSFPPDWDLEGDEWPDLLRDVTQTQPAAVLVGAAGEIDGLLAATRSDDELLRVFFGELGCRYDPRAELGPDGVRAWLMQLAALLRSEAEPA